MIKELNDENRTPHCFIYYFLVYNDVVVQHFCSIKYNLQVMKVINNIYNWALATTID